MLGQDKILRYEPEKGFAQVVIFIASWCLPCQQLMPEFKKLEKDFSSKFTRVVYVFAHDTQADAEGFKQHHKIGDNAMMGTPQILKDFHQPELPSVYIGDRHKWLVMRKLNTKWEDLKEVERFLQLHTAY
ncbi:MAG: TlpA family protein disulfide reductase [Oligoflexus sp.]